MAWKMANRNEWRMRLLGVIGREHLLSAVGASGRDLVQLLSQHAWREVWLERLFSELREKRRKSGLTEVSPRLHIDWLVWIDSF